MRIIQEDVERVIEAADVLDVIQRRVELKRSGGSNWKGLCPFHSERTPSFSVSQDKGLYHCFGCKASGNVITFLRETEGLEFKEAVEYLAELQGYELRYEAGGPGKAEQERNRQIAVLLERAADFYHQQLLKSAEAGKARAYLRQRGYDKKIVVKYRLGYAPRSRQALVTELLREEQDKSQPKDADRSGLLLLANLAMAAGGTGGRDSEGVSGGSPTAEPAGPLIDRFSERLMFPISDLTGKVIGFGGRQLPGGRNPKYINSAQSPVYDKSRVLYGLDKARKAISQQEFVLVCEGYTDVIGFAIAGFANAVATCGTAFTERHAQLLTKHTKKILLAFDADSAGKNAVERFHQFEQKFQLDVAVVRLPEGEDPGQLATSNPEALTAAVKEAQPFYRYLADRVLERHDLSQPISRGRAADELARMMAAYSADLLTETDVAPIASRLPMEPAAFMERVARARQHPRQQGQQRSPSQGSPDQRNDDLTDDPQYLDEKWVPNDPYAPESSHSSADTSHLDGANQGGASQNRASQNRTSRTSSKGAAPGIPLAELIALQVFALRREIAEPYVVTEMFDHPTTRAVFEVVKSSPDGADLSAKEKEKLAAIRDAISSAPDKEAFTRIDETNAIVSLGSAMAAAVDRESRQPKAGSDIRFDTEFRERLKPELLGSTDEELLCELYEEAVNWFNHRNEA